MECSRVTRDRNKGQFPRVGQLSFLACLTQNNRVESGDRGAVNTNWEIEAQRDR